MLDLSLVELAFLRLNARPLDGEAVGVQPCRSQQFYIFFIAVVMVAGLAARLGEAAVRQMLLEPVVAVYVVAFHLMGGGRRADQEFLRKCHFVSSLQFHTLALRDAVFVESIHTDIVFPALDQRADALRPGLENQIAVI